MNAIRAGRSQGSHSLLPHFSEPLGQQPAWPFFIRFYYVCNITRLQKMWKITGVKVKVTPIYYTNTIMVNILIYFFAIFLPTYFPGVTGAAYQIINYMHCLDLNRSEYLAVGRKNPKNIVSGMSRNYHFTTERLHCT